MLQDNGLSKTHLGISSIISCGYRAGIREYSEDISTLNRHSHTILHNLSAKESKIDAKALAVLPLSTADGVEVPLSLMLFVLLTQEYT
jgi:hypothetical protein